ncbi:hypothetical protein CEN47_24000, partial [Fischerella thermalis CCMEE 5319]
MKHIRGGQIKTILEIARGRAADDAAVHHSPLAPVDAVRRRARERIDPCSGRHHCIHCQSTPGCAHACIEHAGGVRAGRWVLSHARPVHVHGAGAVGSRRLVVNEGPGVKRGRAGDRPLKHAVYIEARFGHIPLDTEDVILRQVERGDVDVDKRLRLVAVAAAKVGGVGVAR